MDELRMLIARLGWPSTSARWWTMQELAAWLSTPGSSAETESGLLHLLSLCKLEAEVVEILCIFFMAAQAYGYSPTPKLAENIPRSSILSDLLLGSMGLLAENRDEELEEVPEDFEIPQDFDGMQGSVLPRIFRASMCKLEKRTWLPFVQQMAFEWTTNRAAYPDFPFHGDPWHFSRPLGDDFVGQLSSRTALRAISAYLRTLAAAKTFWDMPPEWAEQEALLALPIHPTLAFLKPCRPAWLPGKTDFDGDTEAIEASILNLVGRVQESRQGAELIAFSSPIVMSMDRCVEVSIVRWQQAAGGSIADADLAAHLNDFWTNGLLIHGKSPEPLSTTTFLNPPPIDQLMDRECKAWPLAAPLGFDRMGYLQYDLYPFRVFVPTIPGSDQIEANPLEGMIVFKANRQLIADLSYWNAGWGPARPRQFGGNCGTALISQGTSYRRGSASPHAKARSFYLWKVRILHRNDTNDRKFSQALVTGAMFV